MHVGSSFIKVCENRLKYVWVASGIIGVTPTTFGMFILELFWYISI
jgi:hypothetical protein